MAPSWKPEAQNFAQFKDAIREQLSTKPAGSEWTVHIQVRKAGNPIHEYRIVLQEA
jgi:hypothetical protein